MIFAELPAPVPLTTAAHFDPDGKPQQRTNPLSPPLRSPQQRPQGHPAKSKFL